MDRSDPNSSADPPTDDAEIRFRDAAPLLEFMCWTVLALAPFLRWVNGPAVSTDQLVTQISVVCVAVVGAISLRVYNWRNSRRAQDAGSEGLPPAIGEDHVST